MVDTRAGPNFVRKDLVLPRLLAQMQEVQILKVRDAKSSLLPTIGLVVVVFRLGCQVVKADFICYERLAATVVLSSDFCDRFVNAIYPRKNVMKTDEGSIAYILRKP